MPACHVSRRPRTRSSASSGICARASHPTPGTETTLELQQATGQPERWAQQRRRLATDQTLGNFDFGFQPSVERARIEALATCQWIRENRTLLIQGPPG